MNLEQALKAATDPSYEVTVRAIAPLVEVIDTDPRAGEALAKLLRDPGDLAVAHAAATALLRRATVHALTIFARAYAEADEQYGDHYNDELRDAAQDQPELLDRLRALADTEEGAREAVDWLTAGPWQPEPEPSWLDRFRGWWAEQMQGREAGPIGVRDAEYLALFDRHLAGELGAHALGKEFRTTYLADPRTGDQERYGTLQRVFFGFEDLAMPGTEPDSDEIGEEELTRIVRQAAYDLRHRRYDWEGNHATGR